LRLYYENRMSKANTPRAVRDLLGSEQTLNRLRRRARESGATEELVALLPPAIARRVTLVRTDERLEILAENNAVAQLARFHAPALEEGAGVPARVRVAPQPGPAATKAAAPRLPADGAACLREAADAIEDPDLAAALRSLASRAGEDE
jgi:hypothetical protein